jgi:hypothetical protein
MMPVMKRSVNAQRPTPPGPVTAMRYLVGKSSHITTS